MNYRKCMAIGCGNFFKASFEHDYCLDCRQKYLGIENPEVIQMAPEMVQALGLIERNGEDQKHNHYFRDVSHLTKVDPYRIIELYNVTNPCLQHILKKALCAGNRGHKDMIRDLEDIRDTIERALEMYDEDMPGETHAAA